MICINLLKKYPNLLDRVRKRPQGGYREAILDIERETSQKKLKRFF
jgi:hypothetical protein